MHAHSLTCTQVQRCHPRTPPAAREWKPSLCPSSQWGSPLVPSPTVEVNWELWCPGKTVQPLALTDDWCLIQQHVTGCNTTLARYCKSWHGYVLKLYRWITLFHDSLHMWSIYRQEIPNGLSCSGNFTGQVYRRGCTNHMDAEEVTGIYIWGTSWEENHQFFFFFLLGGDGCSCQSLSASWAPHIYTISRVSSLHI